MIGFVEHFSVIGMKSYTYWKNKSFQVCGKIFVKVEKKCEETNENAACLDVDSLKSRFRVRFQLNRKKIVFLRQHTILQMADRVETLVIYFMS